MTDREGQGGEGTSPLHATLRPPVGAGSPRPPASRPPGSLVRNVTALIVSLALGVVAGLFDLCGGWGVIALLLFSYLTNAVILSLISPFWSVLFGGLMNTVTLVTVVVGWYARYRHHTASEVQATLDAFEGYDGLLNLWLQGLGTALVVGLIVSFIVRWRSLRRPLPPPSGKANWSMSEESGIWPPPPRGPLP